MKKMLITTVCVAVLSVSAAWANPEVKGGEFDKRPSIEMMKKHGEKLAEKLKLTEEQKVKAEKIRENGRKKMKPLFEQKKELHKKMEKVRKENMEEFTEILTPEQKKEFDEMVRSKHKKHMHHKKHDKK